MTKKTKTTNSELDFLLSYTKMEETFFLSSWLIDTYYNIRTEEKKVQRKKQPRNKPKPLQRNKQMLALAKAISDKVNLKEFAKAFDESYGVVRQWSTNKEIIEQGGLRRSLFCII